MSYKIKSTKEYVNKPVEFLYACWEAYEALMSGGIEE